MNFLKRLFGWHADPTRDWPQLAPGTPVLDLRNMKIGPLTLGSPFSEARALGKPDVYERNAGPNPELLYARSGCLLEYEEERLVFVTYFTGPDEFRKPHEALVFARPKVVLPDGTTRELHADTDVEALVAAFEKPESAEIDEEESVLTWEKGEVTIEAELNERGRLRRLNVFLTN
jgi:hypothetical protein